MTELQYKTIAARIALHCLKHKRFVYTVRVNFGTFTLYIRVRYNGGRRYWILKREKFKVEEWDIIQCTEPVSFQSDRLLFYLN